MIGHDWGGYTAFLLGIAHPDRIGAIVACSTPHPWPPLGPEGLDQLWRSWYAFLNASPLGPALMRRGFARGRLLRGNVGEPFGAEDVEAYAAPLSAPSRVHVTQALYRSYVSSFLAAFKGASAEARLTVPALLLFGRRDVMISHRLITGGYEGHADRLEVELVPDAGHFLVDEKPDLVADARARSLPPDRRRAQIGESSGPSSVRSRCIPTRLERSRMSSRPPGITGSRAMLVPSARRALKQT